MNQVNLDFSRYSRTNEEAFFTRLELTAWLVAAIINKYSGRFCVAHIMNVPAYQCKGDFLRSLVGLLDVEEGKSDEKYVCFCL